MIYKTLSEIKRKIELEHDLLEETFIGDEELTGYINDGIDVAESIIIRLMEDYYLDYSDWTDIVEFNELPENIYANKLRKVEIKLAGGEITPISKNFHLRDKNNSAWAQETKYNIINRAGYKPVLMINDNGDLNPIQIRYHYIRNANRLVKDTDICDLPEITMQHLYAFVRKRCFEKEKDPMAKVSESDIIAFTNLIETTLSNMVDDESPIIEPDLSFYEDYDHGDLY